MVTNTMKAKVQNAALNTISKRAQTECTQIFKNQFVLKVNNTIIESELKIEQKQVEAVLHLGQIIIMYKFIKPA